MVIQFATAAPTQTDDTLTDEQRQLEQRWRVIVPDLFADGSATKLIGTKIRFRTDPWTEVRPGPPVIIKSRSGISAHVSNVSKADRINIATPHKPPTIISVEGVITGIDAGTRTVSIKASKVLVTW